MDSYYIKELFRQDLQDLMDLFSRLSGRKPGTPIAGE
jgi:hypothetical protein